MAKVSEITVQDIKDCAKVEVNDDDSLITLILASSIAFIKNYTGLDDTTIDTLEDLTIALLVLCKDMYDNREYMVQNDKINPIVKSILDMHCVNLL